MFNNMKILQSIFSTKSLFYIQGQSWLTVEKTPVENEMLNK